MLIGMRAQAKEALELMLGHLGFVFEVEEEERDGQLVLNVRTRDPGRLIGREGHTLEDLQYLLNRLIEHDEGDGARVIVDVENYREKEHSQFLNKVEVLADRVRRTGEPEELEAMNSFDRRLVHQHFASDPEIATTSEDSDARLKRITLSRKLG